MSSTTRTLPAQGVKWRHISPAALRGEGLAPYPESGFSALFDWSERMDARSTHVMAYEGQFLIDIVAIEDNAVHQPSKPGDEIVCVLNGILTLTTDGTGTKQIFRKGEYVLIPAGWAGIYRVASEGGLFRELCIVPYDYFDPMADPSSSGLIPRAIEPLQQPGTEILLDTRYTVEMHHHKEPQDVEAALRSDKIVHILAGTLTLEADYDTASFEAGSFVALPGGFKGRAITTAGYQALAARWHD